MLPELLHDYVNDVCINNVSLYPANKVPVNTGQKCSDNVHKWERPTNVSVQDCTLVNNYSTDPILYLINIGGLLIVPLFLACIRFFVLHIHTIRNCVTLMQFALLLPV